MIDDENGNLADEDDNKRNDSIDNAQKLDKCSGGNWLFIC